MRDSTWCELNRVHETAKTSFLFFFTQRILIYNLNFFKQNTKKVDMLKIDKRVNDFLVIICFIQENYLDSNANKVVIQKKKKSISSQFDRNFISEMNKLLSNFKCSNVSNTINKTHFENSNPNSLKKLKQQSEIF